ncbi:TIGR00282 family metallophosphoesterase [Candidatus Dependentiae bacterium]|nr:TIGR00282 family metallophosphoesterase [Candidatus Dependentiae bacterium]
MRVLIIGDVVGNIGCMMVQKHLRNLQEQFQIDATIVNGENSNQNGRGISSKIMNSFKHNGVNVVTTGNHVWDNQDIYEYMRHNNDIIRPANFPSTCPGTGVTTFNCNGIEVAVVNVQGRVFMKESLDCPFLSLDTILNYLKHRTKVIIVDIHAEATAEKVCLGYYVDGRVSCVVGTHTHVQTADERILPLGTAYITDLGMTGSLNSSIGMKKDNMIERFKTQMPNKFIVETEPPVLMTGVWVEIDSQTGKAIQINRVKVIDQDLRAA